MNTAETAKQFWVNQTYYPSYPFIKERRKYELDFLLKNIPHETESLLDLGCGNGSTTILLRETTYIKDFYCYDISPAMLSTIGGNRDSQIHPFAFDVNNDTLGFPTVDVSICMNMLPYVFTDEKVSEIVANLKSDIFITRISCDTERIEINKFSDDLGRDYSAVYRTVEEYANIFGKHYTEVTITRAYPDEIESKYNTKQYFFLCKR